MKTMFSSAGMSSARGWLRAVCLILLLLPAALRAETKTDEDNWDVMYLGKARVGYTRTRARELEENGQKILRMEAESLIVIKRFGQQLKIKMNISTDETPEGKFLGFQSIQENPPADSTKTVGTLKGDQLELDLTTNGKTTHKTLKWEDDVVSSFAQERMLTENPLKMGESRSFKTFLPELNRISTTKYTLVGEEETTLLDGQKKKLQRIDVGQSLVPGVVTRTYTDDEGHTLKTSSSFFGTEMSTYRVSKEVALAAIAGSELDVAMDTLVPVDRIENAHTSSKITYELTLTDGNPLESIPSSDTQHLEKLGPHTAKLTVTRAPAPTGAASEKKAAAEFLKPNRLLQSDDAKVQEHALAAVGNVTDPWQQALLMEKYVAEKLTSKNFSTALASAAEVARDLQGDCTEHACLLAAMCRNRKIPARVVVGLVYADSLKAFGGHMWTEVFIGGHWIPLDPTLGRGGIGGGHIRLADSSLSDDDGNPALQFLPLLNVLGKLQLKVLSVTHQANTK